MRVRGVERAGGAGAGRVLEPASIVGGVWGWWTERGRGVEGDGE